MELSSMKSKTLKVGSEENEDRISGLPDTILSHILSFLPTKYAVQTCILSSRWKSVWTSIHNFSFDYSLWNKNGRTRESRAKFKQLINSVLLLSDSVNIDKFSIIFVDGVIDEEDLPYWKSWVSVALKRNVRVLELIIPDVYTLELPGSIYSSRALEVVKLDLGFLIGTPPPEICFPNVKILHVNVNNLDNNFIESLFCRCPVLEDLVIRVIVISGDPDDVVPPTHINVSSPSLKRFNLSLDDAPSYFDVRQVMVRAPNLECLYITNFPIVSFVMHQLHSLATAEIDIYLYCYYRDGIHSPNERAKHVQHLLRGITNTKSLTLSDDTISALDCSSSFEDLFPTFPNLTSLKVEVAEWRYFPMRYLPIILSRMPMLKEFVFDEKNLEGHIEWNEPLCVPNCLSLHLEKIEIRGFQGKKDELKLVRFLLKNGKVLKRMTIVCNQSAFTIKLSQKLLMFARGSTACEVKFLSEVLFGGSD